MNIAAFQVASKTASCNTAYSFVDQFDLEPSGPPTKETIKYVDESTINFFWSPPHPELRNGIIIHYSVCIREYGPDFACIRKVKVLEGRGRRSYAYGGLNPNREYVVVIRAATIVGLGPPAFVQKTKGMCVSN